MSRSRVALVCENFPPDGGGIAASARRMARTLAPHVEIHVVRFPAGDPSPGFRHEAVDEGGGLWVHAIQPFVNGWSRRPAPAEKARTLRQAACGLAEILRAEGIDLVHGFGLQNAGLVAASASRLSGLPLIQSLRGNDIGRNAFDGLRRTPLAAALAPAWIIAPVNRWLARLVDAHFPDLSGRVRVVANGVDVDLLSARGPSETREARRAGPVVGFLGQLREKKGPHVVAEVARRFLGPRGGTLLLLGGLDLALFHEAGWNGGELPPRCLLRRSLGDRRELSRALDACDFLLFPSLDDGMANALLEAMARGRPVIASPLFDDVVRDGVEGLLVPPLEPAAWVAACEALWADPARRQALGLAARERVRAEFTAAAERDAWLRLYAAVLEESP